MAPTLIALALAMVAAVASVAVFAGPARAETYTNADFAPLVWSEKAIYGPGDEVVLDGSKWQPGESVRIVVNDDQGSTWTRSVEVAADDAGNITDRFNLPGWFVAHYTVTATGASGAAATSGFDDDSVVISSPVASSTQNSTTWSGAISGTTNGGNTYSAKISIKRPDGLYWSGSTWSGTTENLRPLTLTAVGNGNDKTWSYPFPAANHTSTGSYVITVRSYSGPNNVSDVTSATASYTWGLACVKPSVTTQPSSQTVPYGADASFSAAAGGSPAPTVQWQRSTDGSSWSDVANATGASLTVGKPAVAQSGTKYRAQFTNGCGTASTDGAAALTVNKRSVAGTFTAADKTYDGTTGAAITGRSLNDALTGDVVSLDGGTAAFADKNAGTAKTVAGSGFSLTGDAAGNYALASVATTTANIAPRSVAGAFTAANKVYDGNAAATIGGRSLTGAVQGDTVTLNGGSATFADKNAGTGKQVSGTGFALNGIDARNYTLASASLKATADITPKELTGSFTVGDKAYDGTRAATISGGSVATKVGTDAVDLDTSAATASFATAGAGTKKDVSGSGFALKGADAANYTLASAALSTTGDITPKDVVGHFSANGKTYDGDVAATVTDPSVDGVLPGDAGEVSLDGGTGAFESADAGNGKTVTLAGAALTGAKAANYRLASVAAATADITPKDVAGHFAADGKTYDGETSATVGRRWLTDVLDADAQDVALDGGSAAFETAAAGKARTVTLTGATLAGKKAGNYRLTSVATATADIAQRPVTGSWKAQSKSYDGTTDATITDRALANTVTGDKVALTGGSAAFDTKAAGDGKTVTGSGFGLSGDDADNYVLAGVNASTTASITPLAITGSFTANDKVYDATDAAGVLTRGLAGVAKGDTVSLKGGAATFASKNVGAAKTVTLSGASLDGADAGNYALASVATTTAAITPLGIGGRFATDDKVYDGDSAADVASRSLDGVLGKDAVTLEGGKATFADKSAGADKTVSLTGATLAGDDAANYVLSGVADAKATIGKRPVTGSWKAQSKVYDGTTDATIADRALANTVTGDKVALADGTAAFDSKSVGDGKTVTGSGFGLSGEDADNYDLAGVNAATTASITPLAITGSFTANDKVYDATVAAGVLTRELAGVVEGDTVSLKGGTATFGSKDVGTEKTVKLSGASLDGADAGNYTLASVATTTAAIKPLRIGGRFAAKNKVYDGGVSADVTSRSLSGVLGDDGVTLQGGTATFADKGAGADKAVSLTGATLAGEDAGNYALAGVADAKATIGKRLVTGSWKAQNKVYDGTTDATIVDRALANAVTGDKVALTGGTAAFDTKVAGVGKTVTGSGLALSGDDAVNYDLTSVNATATADIIRRTVAGVVTVADKVFDTTTAATVTSRGVDGKVAGDQVTLIGGTATFDSAVPGERTATLTGALLDGADKGNYALDNAAITAKATIRAWAFKGFLAPIDTKTTAGAWIFNTAKAGSAIPVKFSLGGDKGLNVFASGYPMTTTVTCSSGATTDAIEELAAGTTSGLKYDATADQYNYTWKTATTLAGKCVRLDVKFIDGQTRHAYFNFTK